MDNAPIDNSSPTVDNTQVDEVYEVFNMAGKPPLNDPNCKHANVVKDNTEELGDAFMCQDCKLGWIMAKTDSPT